MNSWAKRLCVLCVLCGSALQVFSLDREAFSFTSYDLNLQIEPEQHRLGVRGKITLRNDTATPQKIAVLQISSSLNWRSIKAGDKAVQFVTQPYTSDIDHTGGLSEAIVTLPQAVEPHTTVELEIGYEGIIPLDATRLTRIGMPDDLARRTDWDQIDTKFTGLRGAGYVAWYPIATDVANLSEGNSLFEVLARWKTREAGSMMRLQIGVTRFGDDRPPDIFLSGFECPMSDFEAVAAQHVSANCPDEPMQFNLPILVIADYQMLEKPGVEVRYLRGHDARAAEFADIAGKIAPFISDWFGARGKKASTADLPDPKAAPFESSALLLTPLANDDSKLAGLAIAHQLTHAAFFSRRPWIDEGLAHFAQALYLEQQNGRQAALDYMGLHRSALGQMEPSSEVPRSDDEATRALVNTTNEALDRSKSMYVWWMLRDIIGDAALKKALADYRPEQDKEPSYLPRLITAQTQRDLEWFFDDWVYRDRGLPDFKVESAFSRKTMGNAFMLTVTVNNMGTAGAEVPIMIKFAGGEVTKRLEIRAKDKATIRVETPGPAQEVRVNDGSVPERNLTNNTFKVEPPQS
jgi:hypothetical protein